MIAWRYPYIFIGIVAVALPAWANSGYVSNIGVISLLYVMLGASFNLIFGMTGYLAMTHAAFFGIGAYVAAIASTTLGWGFPATLAAGLAVPSVLSLALGGLIFRRVRGFPFAIVTLGVTLTLWVVANHWVEVTRGPLGIPGIPRPNIAGVAFGDSTSYFYLGVVLAGVVVGTCWLVSRTDVGRVLKAIGGNERMAATLGLDTYRYKLLAYVLASGFAGVAGVYYAHYLSVVSTEVFFVYWITLPLVIVHLAGLGNLPAVVAVAAALVIVPEFLRATEAYQQLFYGSVLVLAVAFLPKGIGGWLARQGRRLDKRPT
jgi:ABC-type branched-subunit amino acid transport system permease subunit